MKRFSGPQILLHWLTLLMLIVTYCAMEFKDLAPKHTPMRDFMHTLHYNAGVIVWLLMFIRLLLHSVCRNPPIIPELAHWQRLSAKIVHILLYLLFLSLPILGVLIEAYGGHSWSFFGKIIQPWVTPDRTIASVIKEVHETLANIGYAIIAIHVLAALVHHYIQRDNTLLRMLPARWSGGK